MLEHEEDWQWAKDEGLVAIVVNTYTSNRELKRAFSEFLAERLKKDKGRPPLDESYRNVYGFFQYPYVKALSRTLAVFDLWSTEQSKKINGQKYLSLYDIGAKLLDKSAHLLNGREEELDKADKIVKMRTTVSRHVRDARNIIANVEKGIFPKRDYP